MPTFKVSQKAEQDLFDIGAYTQIKWGREQRNRYLNELNAVFHQLLENTEHPSVKNRDNVKNGCFSFDINKHTIIFRKTNYGIRIVRVLHQRMDIHRQL